MTVFLVTCVGLLLLGCLFLLFPRRERGNRGQDDTRANLEWLRLREAEVEGDEALAADARLRLLEDERQGSGAPVEPPAATSAFPLWPLPLFLVIFSGVVYYQLGAAPDVLIARQLQSIAEDSPPEQMQELMRAIESRAAQRPDNLHYTALLGRFYMGQQDYARAATTYTGLARRAPGDAQALAYAAQAEYLARGRNLTSEAQMLAEQSLAIDPHQRTALGLLGMAAFEQQQYRAAIDYWQRLVAMEPAGSETARMISGVIESARQKLGEGGELTASSGNTAVTSPHTSDAAAGVPAAGVPAAGVPAAGVPAAPSPGVTVRVSAPAGASIGPEDTVFVLARNARSESRMPVAVQRFQGSQLPVTLRLDDSMSMAGQKLSDQASVMVVVQVSPDGRPGEAAATWLGSAGPLAPSLDQEPLEITLAPRS